MSISKLDKDPSSQSITSYQVNTPIYEGPLDLLLQLIERAELDITRLALAQVTDQYLAHIQNLSERIAADEVSSFLVIASRLIQIKSETLLPRPPLLEPEEEDPADMLARQLRTYKRFKELSGYLNSREEASLGTYVRISQPFKVETRFELTELSLDQLKEVAIELYQRATKVEIGTVVKPPRITIREKIKTISRFLQANNRGNFINLLSGGHRLEIVVTFLAILELMKRRMISVNQENIFGDIEIEKHGDWTEEESFELEFGE